MKNILQVIIIFAIITIIGCDITNKTEAATSDIQIEVIRPIFWEEFSDDNLIVDLLINSTQEIQNVKLFVDGDSVFTLTSAPYHAEIPLSEIGTHNFYAVATDELNFQKNSSIINFSIQSPDQESPSGFIAFPADWSNVSGNFDVIISAQDNENIASVRLFLDGEIYSTNGRELFEFTVDSTELSNDYHTLFAEIEDEAGNYTTTQLVTVRISN